MSKTNMITQKDSTKIINHIKNKSYESIIDRLKKSNDY
jgi:flagellar motor switch protein FliG